MSCSAHNVVIYAVQVHLHVQGSRNITLVPGTGTG